MVAAVPLPPPLPPADVPGLSCNRPCPCSQAEVRVLGEDRESLGILPIARALELAREREVDLILTVPEARPPLCR